MRQRDAPQTDACLRRALDTVVQPVRGADYKGHIPCTAHGTVGDHSSQILTRHLFALHTECDKIRALAHRCKDGLALLLQCLGNLLITGIFVRDLYLRQFHDAEAAEAAQSFLVLGYTRCKVGGVHLADADQINILHGSPLKTRCTGLPRCGTASGSAHPVPAVCPPQAAHCTRWSSPVQANYSSGSGGTVRIFYSRPE